MILKFMHLRAASLAIAILSVAAPALAQDPLPVTFENIRDAVRGFFSPSPRAIVLDANTNTTTLHIGFENAFKACAPFALPIPLPCSDTRVAMDTLSFVVRAPAGYYVSSLTIDQAGTGAISRLADARGASGSVVAGEPVDLGGPFGGENQFSPVGDWFRSRTVDVADKRMTAVPVSLTTGLFAYAGATSGSARVELESATVAVTIALLEDNPAPVKKTATIDVIGFTGTYDGDFHGATGTAIGPDREDLSGRLVFDQMFKNAPGGTVNWTFPADPPYNGASGTAEVVISPAIATIAVTGFTGTYDGLPHGATGTATGISGIAGDLNAHLLLGDTFTNAPGGIATWSFGGDPNYHAATGAVAITINKATPVLTWPEPAPIFEGTRLSATQLNAAANVAGTFNYQPRLGTELREGRHTLSVTFTPTAAGNYTSATASVSLTVRDEDDEEDDGDDNSGSGSRIADPGNQGNEVGDDVRLQIHVNAGVSPQRHGRGRDGDNHRGGRLRGKFSAAALPAGLRIQDDGEIRGRLTTEGSCRVVVTFTHDGNRGSVSRAFDWKVLPKSPTNKKGKR